MTDLLANIPDTFEHFVHFINRLDLLMVKLAEENARSHANLALISVDGCSVESPITVDEEMPDIVLVETRAIFVLLPHVRNPHLHLLLAELIVGVLDDRLLRTSNHLVTEEHELLRMFPNELLHVLVKLLPCVVIGAKKALIDLCVRDVLDVPLLEDVVFNDAQVIDDYLAEQPLFVEHTLVQLQDSAFEKLTAVQVGQNLEQHIVRNRAIQVSMPQIA